MSVLCDGWRCIYSLRVVARERAATQSKEEYRRKVRIGCRAFNCHRLLWPRLRQLSIWNFYKYASHKLIRWLTAFWILGAAVAIVGGILTLPISWPTTMLVLFVPVAFGLAVWGLPMSPWLHLKEATIAIAATGRRRAEIDPGRAVSNLVAGRHHATSGRQARGKGEGVRRPAGAVHAHSQRGHRRAGGCYSDRRRGQQHDVLLVVAALVAAQG